MSLYAARGVSCQKEDVHSAIANVDKGLYPGAFCKIIPDVICGDPNYCVAMHSDGAGTKSSMAYVYWRETGDYSVFEGIIQDAVVMNTDDLLCAGASGAMLVSTSIGRNAKVIDGVAVKTLIEAQQKLSKDMKGLGLELVFTGGETADIGDVVRTLIVDSTITCRFKREEVVTNDGIAPGHVIFGLSSTGQTTYEAEYNSGIGSNGLTMARHDLLDKLFLSKYPESCDSNLDKSLLYCGPYKLTDPLEDTGITIGKAILSPTRTYAPIVMEILKLKRNEVYGMVHCTGGGQTKCLNFGKGVRYVKDNLFPCPPIFKAIQNASSTPWSDMYQIFNMGHRMEIFGPPSLESTLRQVCSKYNLELAVIGRVEKSLHPDGRNELVIESPHGAWLY